MPLDMLPMISQIPSLYAVIADPSGTAFAVQVQPSREAEASNQAN
jgi:hypothetical protein